MKLYHFQNGLCNTCGSKIREFRENNRMSQEDLATALQLIGLNINQKAISRIETGERVIPDYELLYFSKVFEVEITELFPKDQIVEPH
ncbi:MAG: helix-turn-helix transcriptional regulator [Lachnospiraceae bacterium]|nr:helix-turn-helix transcriptional regulator [Lachnospiraceae bacterium]